MVKRSLKPIDSTVIIYNTLCQGVGFCKYKLSEINEVVDEAYEIAKNCDMPVERLDRALENAISLLMEMPRKKKAYYQALQDLKKKA